jgi:hypothetical protein
MSEIYEVDGMRFRVMEQLPVPEGYQECCLRRGEAVMRQFGEKSMYAEHALMRYVEMMTFHDPSSRFERAELEMLRHAAMGVIWGAIRTSAVDLLVAQVEDGDHYEGLGCIHGVEVGRLVAKLRTLNHLEALALMEFLSLYWADAKYREEEDATQDTE